MSFVTNNRTRRTKRARTHGTAPDVSSAYIGGARAFESNPTLKETGRKTTLTDTIIGSHHSKGLTIIGGSANADLHHGENIDGRSIPFGTSGEDDGLDDGYPNSNMAHPPYPISYHGPGYMRITNPISIPTIIHPLHVKDEAVFGGNVTIRGSLTVEAETLPGDPFLPVIQDALGNELTGVTTTSTYISETTVDYFEVLISWTGFANLDPAQQIRLTGFPLTNYSITSASDVTGHGGIATTSICGKLHTLAVPGQNYIVLEEADQAAGTAPTDILGANFFGPGEIHIFGHLRKT